MDGPQGVALYQGDVLLARTKGVRVWSFEYEGQELRLWHIYTMRFELERTYRLLGGAMTLQQALGPRFMPVEFHVPGKYAHIAGYMVMRLWLVERPDAVAEAPADYIEYTRLATTVRSFISPAC